MPSSTLNPTTLLEGISYLTKIDADLANVIFEIGNPPLWYREPGFATMIHIILEQQVSLASARAAYRKLEDTLGSLLPERFLELTDEELKAIGFSRQKTSYARELSKAILAGVLDLEKLSSLEDESVRSQLTKIKGIGPWTANIYLLMALLRPDVWPSGDLALAKAAQKVKNLAARPTSEKLTEIAEAWRPWRAVAARVLWHYYLSQ